MGAEMLAVTCIRRNVDVNTGKVFLYNFWRFMTQVVASWEKSSVSIGPLRFRCLHPRGVELLSNGCRPGHHAWLIGSDQDHADG